MVSLHKCTCALPPYLVECSLLPAQPTTVLVAMQALNRRDAKHLAVADIPNVATLLPCPVGRPLRWPRAISIAPLPGTKLLLGR